MTTKPFRSTALLAGLLVSIGSAARAATITVSAAASLKNALTQIGQDYQKQSGTKVHFNFGSSGALQRQIEEGAPVNVFVPAAERNMNELASRGLIERGTRRVIAGNRLVLIVPVDGKVSIRSFGDLAKASVRHVALGGPQVPAGLRAQEVLTRLGIWKQVRAKAVRGKDVREVLTQVERGNVEAGIVYHSDAVAGVNIREVAIAPTSMHAPIRYPAAVVAKSANAGAARGFVKYLTTRAAKAHLRRSGFLTP